MPNKQPIARWRRDLRRARRAKGWGQADLADRAGVSLSTISRIELGHLNPTMDTVEQLAQALGTTISIATNGLWDTPEARAVLAESLAHDCLQPFTTFLEQVLHCMAVGNGPSKR